METLLSPRLKNIVLGVLCAVLACAVLALGFFPAASWSPTEIEARVGNNCARMETALTAKINQCVRRSDDLLGPFQKDQLQAADLRKKEALIIEKNGIIADYVGEIYFFKFVPLRNGEWRLIKKNQDIYFLRRLDGPVYYLSFFMDSTANFIRNAAAYSYPVFDLKFSAEPLPHARGNFSHDRAKDCFYYTRILKPSQNQLVLTLVFSEATLAQQPRRARKLFFYGLIFLLFLTIFLTFPQPRLPQTVIRIFALGGMAFATWWWIAWLGWKNIYFPRSFLAAQSVYQFLALLVFLLLIFQASRRFVSRKNNFAAFLVFNGLALGAFFAADRILVNVSFPCGDFALHPDYLALLTLLSGLLLAPLLAAAHFLNPVTWRRGWPIIALQALALFFCYRWLPFPVIAFALLALAFSILLLKPFPPWLRVVLPLLLLGLTVDHLLLRYSQQEKQAFVRENLKIIFSSQDHYAKLVAREIVYELNSRQASFYSFFEKNDRAELANCWQNTLAARENIASGIYIVAADGSLRNAFSYQIPYIDLKKENIFPFWHIETMQADLFGKKINLAVAAISVFHQERCLGYIMVQVLNSAELILKSGERVSLLTLDSKIKDPWLSYITFDENLRVLENPANINADNLMAWLKLDDSWVNFSTMDIRYRGYIFKNGDETAVIFYPRNTFFKSFSEYIKIVSFLLLLAALFNLHRLGRLPWGYFFQSYSVKVFAILLLLSMLTATVFSIFSLNFNAISQETSRRQATYQRGRSAVNIINNLLAGGGEITQDHMYLLEKILENDISVYEKGTLLFTSDYRKIIRNQLPIYMNSGIRDLLQQEGRQFELRQNRNSLDLFFKTAGNYVFEIDFPLDSADQLRAQNYYVDFMVTIFFVLIVIGLAAAFFFRNQLLAPIHRLNRGMTAVRQGDLRPLADIPAEIELRELYQGFNSMLGGIQEQKKSVSEISKMKTLVQLGRRVAHEVKNPLTPIRLSAEQILHSLQDAKGGGTEVILHAVHYIIEETEHLRQVAYGFLNLSKLDELKTEPFRLNDLVTEAVAHLRSIYPRVCFTVNGEQKEIAVVADRLKIRQVIDNVLTNALEAVAGKDGHVEVALAQEGDFAEILITDNGPGMSPEELERLVNEEYSSKDMGTGLGLAIARRFLELHRGNLEIHSQPAVGTTVTMRFVKNVQPS